LELPDEFRVAAAAGSMDFKVTPGTKNLVLNRPSWMSKMVELFLLELFFVCIFAEV
jgi:hypothetical protein